MWQLAFAFVVGMMIGAVALAVVVLGLAVASGGQDPKVLTEQMRDKWRERER